MGKISKSLVLLLAFVVAMSCLVLIATELASAQTMFTSSIEAVAGESTGPKLLWNFKAEGLIYSVTINSGLIFVCSPSSSVLDNCHIYALNSSNGAKVWDFSTRWIVGHPPAFADGVLYAGDGGGNFYAVNISDGQKIWNFTIGHIEGSPVISNGVVYFGSNILSGSKVFALNASTGLEVWNCTIGLPMGAVVPRTYLSSVAEGYGAVYVIDGGSDPALYAINKSSGDLLWKAPIGENVFAPSTSPCVGEGKVFVGCAINYGTDHPKATLLAFDAANGNLIWNKTGPVGGGFSTPLLSNGRIYVSGGGTLQAVNSIDGALLWNVSGTSYSDPYIANGKLYAISGNNILSYQPKCNVLILDAFNGKTIMNYQTDGDFKSESAPVFANGTVYFGNLTHVLALGGSLVSTPTPSPSSTPTPTPTASQNPSPISTPTPTIPELPTLTIPLLLILMVAAGLLVYFKKHKQMKLDRYE